MSKEQTMLRTKTTSILPATAAHRLRLHSSLALTALCALASFGASTAQAKTTTNHPYQSVIQTTALSTANGYPGIGGTAVLAGSWATSRYGKGALVDHVKITGRQGPTMLTFRGSEVAYLARGTFTDTFTGTVDVLPGGNQFIVIDGRVTGGTGAYHGAKGSYTFKGMTLAGSTITNGSSAGASSY
jgi:hypothetical protein